MNNEKKTNLSISVYLRWPLVLAGFVFIMNLLLAALSPETAIFMAAFTIIFIGVAVWLYFYSKRGLFGGLVSFAQGFDNVQKRLMNDMDHPYVICDRQGYIIWSNRAFREILKAEDMSVSHIQAVFPDITRDMLAGKYEDALIHSAVGNRYYCIEMMQTLLADDDDLAASLIEEAEKEVLVLSVFDETELVEMTKLYQDSKLCEGLIYIDNYEEALETVEEVRRSLLTALVERKISNYVSSMNGVVKKVEKDKYFFIIKDADLRRMIDDRFSVLDDVKTINIGNEMSLTLSIGIGMEGGDYKTDNEAARTAMDLALGRGGDQAVLKDGDDIQYFGGKSLAMEKTTRVKARVKAHAFKELLDSKEKLIVMGHKMADVDCLGAAVGFWKIANVYGKKAYIVMGSSDNAVKPIRKQFTDSPDYPREMFINGDRAMELLDNDTIVVVSDVNRPSYTEEPRLIDACDTVVVLDHHRKTSETISNAVLSYVEPYASSASELVAEILQYIGDDIRLTPQEADAMYAGMVVDTQNFTNQTGVRTFEAAAYLKRNGADIVRVRKMFRDNLNDYRAKAEAIDKAEIYRDCFAIGVCDPEGTESPTVVGAQAANSLLDIRSIKAAIVLTPFNGKIYLSARSIDEVNVQVMMEKLGGGGHKSVAGAQLSDMSLDEAKQKLKAVIDEMMNEGDIL
ncbi:MAG TPA: DHH family phosphoesterase [Candidatus Avilachnospira avicola]|nr:DHH family phosphoesterase [Candidatus Avilachnospira avicola]